MVSFRQLGRIVSGTAPPLSLPFIMSFSLLLSLSLSLPFYSLLSLSLSSLCIVIREPQILCHMLLFEKLSICNTIDPPKSYNAGAFYYKKSVAETRNTYVRIL